MKKTALLLLLALLYGLLAWGWYFSTSHLPMGNPLLEAGPDRLKALGRLAGVLAAGAWLVQLMLIGRIKWIEPVWGHDRLVHAHRFHALAVLVLVAAHVVLVTWPRAQDGELSILGQFKDFIQNYDDVGAAMAGALLIAAVALLSMAIVRKWLSYEWWHGTHLFAYAALALAFGHQMDVGLDFSMHPAFGTFWWSLYGFVLANILWYRFLSPVWRWNRHRFVVDRIVQESKTVHSVYLRGRNMAAFSYRPGQFVIVRFLARGFWWEAHPFTISMPPGGHEIRVSIKQSGDFTSRISRIPPGTSVIVDGPHGGFTAALATQPGTLLIAGGIGITPMRAMIEPLRAAGREVTLLWGMRQRADIVFGNEWRALAEDSSLAVHHVFSHDPEGPGEHGQINRECIARLVPDVSERDVFLCGPPPMMRGVIATLKRMGVPARRIHYERFSF